MPRRFKLVFDGAPTHNGPFRCDNEHFAWLWDRWLYVSENPVIFRQGLSVSKDQERSTGGTIRTHRGYGSEA